ncbi:MAG: MarR family winged helix-turn-helix transcriptional regulator [Labedaea sp.]
MESRDSVDDRLERWLPALPSLDPDIEAVVTRMAFLVRHLGKVKERSLAEYDLQDFEFSTLRALAVRGGRAVPSELVAELRVSPAAMTGRLDSLQQRGYVHRQQSSVDRRRVDVELTESGSLAWRAALDAVGREERRILGALPPADRRQLSDLLRRLLVVAEQPEPREPLDRRP